MLLSCYIVNVKSLSMFVNIPAKPESIIQFVALISNNSMKSGTKTIKSLQVTFSSEDAME